MCTHVVLYLPSPLEVYTAPILLASKMIFRRSCVRSSHWTPCNVRTQLLDKSLFSVLDNLFLKPSPLSFAPVLGGVVEGTQKLG